MLVITIDARTQVHQPRPFQRPDRSLKADRLDERSTSNGAVRERVEPARLGGRWFGADSQPHGQSGSRGMTSCLPARREEVGAPPPDRPPPSPSPRDLQRCLKVRQVRHRAPPWYTKSGADLPTHKLTANLVKKRPPLGNVEVLRTARRSVGAQQHIRRVRLGAARQGRALLACGAAGSCYCWPPRRRGS